MWRHSEPKPEVIWQFWRSRKIISKSQQRSTFTPGIDIYIYWRDSFSCPFPFPLQRDGHLLARLVYLCLSYPCALLVLVLSLSFTCPCLLLVLVLNLSLSFALVLSPPRDEHLLARFVTCPCPLLVLVLVLFFSPSPFPTQVWTSAGETLLVLYLCFTYPCPSPLPGYGHLLARLLLLSFALTCPFLFPLSFSHPGMNIYWQDSFTCPWL